MQHVLLLQQTQGLALNTQSTNTHSTLAAADDSQAGNAAAIHRRTFLQKVGLQAAGVATLSIAGSQRALAQLDNGPIRIGMIADLHQDVMPDGRQRLDAFLKTMKKNQADAIIQLGDFATPRPENQPLIDTFNNAHPRALHVLGNHDIDGGFTTAQTMAAWGMKKRYYARDIKGLRVIVLDGNEKYPGFEGKYPSHVGPEQQQWLRDQLKEFDGPILVLCHQPLAGAWAIDNEVEIQKILSTAADRVLLAVNGHSHIDQLLHVGNVNYLHLNSASYVFVGIKFKHDSYPPEVMARHPKLGSTCPYKDALFATFTIDPVKKQIQIEGTRSSWLGPSPGELGRVKHPDLKNGEQIVPQIRSREIEHLVT